MISASLSPNTECDDVLLAIKVLCMPWTWKQGRAVVQVEQWLGGVSFNSGRSALLAILKAFEVGSGDEVIVQAFSCVAVANSVIWAGATPVYVDIDDTYNIDVRDVGKKITPRTKVIIVQHTFGIPAAIDEIISIAKKHNIKVIEDFAHTMSEPMKGDAAFYSFGRDKVLSSVFGGLAIGADVNKYHKTLPYPSMAWIFQQLLHPIAFSIILPLYRVGIGKVILVTLQRLHLLSFPQISEIKKYPNGLAILLVNQLNKLDRYTKQRKEIVKLYGARLPAPDRPPATHGEALRAGRDGGQGNGPLLRFPMFVDNPEKIIDKAKKQGILLGNWYHNVIDPLPVSYIPGSCPKAEEAAKHIINLPTRISLKDAKRVMRVL